jgi:hypothetical protein
MHNKPEVVLKISTVMLENQYGPAHIVVCVCRSVDAQTKTVDSAQFDLCSLSSLDLTREIVTIKVEPDERRAADRLQQQRHRLGQQSYATDLDRFRLRSNSGRQEP